MLCRIAILGLVAACANKPAPPPPEPSPEPRGAVLEPGEGLRADLARAESFFATRPRLEQPLDDGLAIPEGVGSLSAQACGACHAEIASEWALSTHAHAWVDRQYQAEILKSDNRWICLNCHTPLLVQQDRWPVGLVNDDVERPRLVQNPAFDAALRDEGITCAACHVVDGTVHGPGLGGDAPHPVTADARFRGDDLCLRCHQAVATYPGKSFVCTFETGAEWAAGPYATEGTGCVDCHMPVVARPAAEGGPVRQVRRHTWRGAGIPKVPGVQPPVASNPPGLDVAATWTGTGLALALTNARAGHMLPSGDPERWVQVDVTFQDEGGTTLETWTTRIGQRWAWWPEPRKLEDNRLKPRERRTFDVPVPDGAVRARIVASSHRMAQETADYHALAGYPLSVETHAFEVSR